jgi:hypothetical protein
MSANKVFGILESFFPHWQSLMNLFIGLLHPGMLGFQNLRYIATPS